MADYVRYQQQFEALIKILNELESVWRNLESTQVPRAAAILHLLQGLRLFASNQFNFFFYGFNGSGGATFPRLNPAISEGNQDVVFPPEHVLAATIAQISADIALIRSVAEQRRFPLAVGNTRDFLGAVDKLALTALWPPKRDENVDVQSQAKDGNDREVKTVLTYFTASVNVRVMPYSQIALIGIPFSCTLDSDTLLSIPHEVGHFRYWYSFKQPSVEQGGRSRFLEGKWMNVRELFFDFVAPDELPGSSKWSEEIFADVYAALVGGPLAALSAQTLALEHSTHAFTNVVSDDAHPTPFLRPLILIKALHKFSSKLRGTLKSSGGSDHTDGVPGKLRLKMVTMLFNEWQRRLIDRKILSLKDSQQDVNDDSTKLECIFVDSDLSRFVEENLDWSWALGDQDRQLPLDKVVQKAMIALEYVFEVLNASPLDWGWSQGLVENEQRWETIQDVGKIGQEVLLERLRINVENRADLNQSFANPDVELLPQQWDDWVGEEGKGYFSGPYLGKTLYSGEYADMSPVRDSGNAFLPPVRNIWLRVFGASGWTTEGPCVMPPH